jgi:hypothetical protein
MRGVTVVTAVTVVLLVDGSCGDCMGFLLSVR